MDIRIVPRALVLALSLVGASALANEALVFQTDFGLKDGAVSAMKGVAFGVDRTLPLHDLTHEIPAYNIWEASYRLYQTLQYWPAGTVFVSVVDPVSAPNASRWYSRPGAATTSSARTTAP